MRRFLLVLGVIVAIAPIAEAQLGPEPAELDRIFGALNGYAAGQNVATLEDVKEYVDLATTRYRIRVEAEERLLKVLSSRQTSAAAKEFAANQLYRLCDEDTIPAFRDLLLRSDTSRLARQGLERIDHPRAQEALLKALDHSTGSVFAGIVESLGNKRDPSSVGALRRTAKAGNLEVTRLALTGLSKIPGYEAMEALDWCRVNLSRAMRPEATQAFIQNGWTNIGVGEFEAAIEAFDSLMIEVEPAKIRAQGLRGLIRAQQGDAVPTIIEGLTSDVPELQTVAAEEAGKVPTRAATEAFVLAFPDVDPPNQAVLLRAFGERGDEAALDTLTLAVKSRHTVVRRAAIEALGDFNHPDVLESLLRVAASGTPEEEKLARAALNALSDPRINDALVKAGNSADNAVRFEAVRTIVDRKAANAVPVLLRIAERDVEAIRVEALRALGVLGTVTELPFMVAMLLDASTPDSKSDIKNSVLQIAKAAPPGEARINPITDALRKFAELPEDRIMLVTILEEIGDDSALPALEEEARSRTGAQRRSVEVLAAWPSDEPMDTLERVASTTNDAEIRQIAFNGLVQKLQHPSDDRTVETTLRYYQRAAKIAETPDEKRALIQGLTAIPHEDGLKLVERYLKDPDIGEYAAQARDEISRQLSASG